MTEITAEMYKKQKFPKFGNKNPERMQNPFWEWMIENKESAYWARKHFNDVDLLDSPVWCFDRFGMSQTELPDGRIVYIAGEHEDHYDPDFYIYNDVIVIDPDGKITIWGYPKNVFPQTDFHSATLIGDNIYIIGSAGYVFDRKPGFTPVYILDTTSFQIKRLETSGENPGWIFRHQGELDDTSTKITLRLGQQIVKGQEDKLTKNFWQYQLNLISLKWKKFA